MANYHDEPTYARFNNGRWLAHCPDCARKGMTIAEPVQPGEDFICPIESPGLLATIPIMTPLTEREKAVAHKHGVQTAFRVRALPDEDARAKARESAVRYRVIWPKEKKKIEDLLRMRPVAAMNWEPGETLDFIRAENAAHGMQEVR